MNPVPSYNMAQRIFEYCPPSYIRTFLHPLSSFPFFQLNETQYGQQHCHVDVESNTSSKRESNVSSNHNTRVKYARTISRDQSKPLKTLAHFSYTFSHQSWPEVTVTRQIHLPKTSKLSFISEKGILEVALLLMNLSPFIFLLLLFNYGSSQSDIRIGYQLMMAVPVEYAMGFAGRAFLMQTNQTAANFRVAVSVEAINGKYSCSLEVFLGDVKVWDSGHYSRFYTTEKCELELTQDGDLRLKGPKERVGWKTGTSGQGVERLQILRTGNLVLVDALNNIKWQSFNFPTDVMLWGQRLDVATRLTSFRSNSSLFYSFEIQNNRIALYLNSGKLRYSYWEFKPSMNRSITFVKLGSRGLNLFDVKYKKIAQIPSQWFHPLRFLALKNETGNFGLYYYSPEKTKFEASFQALNSTCDLPVACRPYGICTFSNACSCVRPLKKENEGSSDCIGEISGGFCGGKEAEMLELENVSTVLKDVPKMVNISREACENLCLQDCKCAAALYFMNASNGEKECYLYRLVLGLKQVEEGTGFSYMVKVLKGTGENNGPHNLKKWVFILVGVVDGLIILLVVGGVGYWTTRKRSHTLHSAASTS